MRDVYSPPTNNALALRGFPESADKAVYETPFQPRSWRDRLRLAWLMLRGGMALLTVEVIQWQCDNESCAIRLHRVASIHRIEVASDLAFTLARPL